MACPIEVQDNPAKGDVLVGRGTPFNVIEVKPVSYEIEQENSINVDLTEDSKMRPPKNEEKERLLNGNVKRDDDIELKRFASNCSDAEMNEKLLSDDLETHSLTSIDDSPTFSKSKLMISTDDLVEETITSNNESDHLPNDVNNNSVEHLSDVSSSGEQNEPFEVPVVTHRDSHSELERRDSKNVQRSCSIESDRISSNDRRSNESISLSLRGSQHSSADIPGAAEIEETSFSTRLTMEGEEGLHLSGHTHDETSQKGEEEEVEEEDEEEDEEEITEHMKLMETKGELSEESMEREEPDEVGEEPDDDNDSVLSEFRGSLGIDVQVIPWEVDIDRVVDIQLGEDEWGTEIYQPEGGVRLEGWETKILDISKGEEIGEDWSTTMNDISGEELHAEWNTEIAEQFENKELQIDWSTTFNKIEKADETKNKWTTIFRKIKEHISPEGEWSTTFNRMSIQSGGERDWDFKISRNFENLAQNEDWNTNFTQIEGGSNADDPWPHTYNDMLLMSDDRKTHWETKFIPISENTDEMNPWETTFLKMAPPDDEEIWDTTFYGISSEKNLPEDWNTKFIDIEPHVEDENEWSIEIEDIPDNFNVPEDWSTMFKKIENHEANLLWDTYFLKILPPDELLDRWEDTFYDTDLTDIDREMWETTFYGIEYPGDEYDWTIQTNPIECQE